jgi:glucan phosphoethanolaminetransferase (alkaline phosphatase superfamily)
MPLPVLEPGWTHGLEPVIGPSMRTALRWGSEHTGLPIILVAAIAMVVSWRAFKRSLRFVIEVVVAVALLAVATRLGWITW